MGQQDWNLLGKHIFKPNAPIDARELVNSDSDIVNIDSAYVGMIVTVNSNPIKRYKIKKVTWEGHPDSIENGGYELIQEPKDLKYSDGVTSFLNNNGNIDADYLKFADIDGSEEEKSTEDDFNVKTDTLRIDGTTYENSKKLSIRNTIGALENITSMQNVQPVIEALNNRTAKIDQQTSEIIALGYKVLNPVLSFAEQVNAPNTVYEIKDSFDLNDGSVTIPTGCVLKFNGGKVKNGSIAFSNTSIISDYACFENVAFSGTVTDKDGYFELLGIVENDVTETANIKWAFEHYRNVYLKPNAIYKYLCSSQMFIHLQSNTTVYGNNATFVIDSDYENIYALFYLIDVNDIVINGVNISCTKGGTVIRPNGSTVPNSKIQGIHCTHFVTNLTVSKCSFTKCSPGIKVSSLNSEGKISNVYVRECDFTDSFNGLQGHIWDNLHIDNCTFLTTENGSSHRLYLYPIDGSNAYINNCIFKQVENYGAVCQFYYDGNVESHSKIYMTDCFLEASKGSGAGSCIIVSNGVELYMSGSTLKNGVIAMHTTRNTLGSYISVNKCNIIDCSYMYGRITFNNSVWDGDDSSLFLMALDGTADAEILNSTINTGNSFISIGSSGSYSNLPKRIEGCNITCGYNNKAFLYGNTATSGSVYNSALIVRNCKLNIGHILYLNDATHTGSVTFDSCEFVNNPTVYKNDHYSLVDCKIINSTRNKKILNKKVYNDTYIDYQQPYKGASIQRPSLPDADAGYQYYDTTLKKPIYWNGTAWVDANGETVGLQVNDTSVLVGAAADSSVTINVYHANALTVSALNPDNTPATWLTIPSTIAVGTATLTISATENTSSNPRGAKVIISDGTDVVIVNVVQNYSTT